MLDKLITFQVGGFYGGGFGGLLASLEQAGFFAYVLPFLLIFALIFAILTRTQIFKDNKGINGVIAFVIGLLALQFDFVPIFFSEIFPRLGIGLAIILAMLILVGLFFDPKNKFINYSLLIVGVVVFLVVLIKTMGWVGWTSGAFWSGILYNWQMIAAILAVIIGVAIAFKSVSPKKTLNIPELNPILFRGNSEN